jgi:hypothetical protein
MRISFLSKSRGIRNLISRIRTVAKRFGITSGKFDKLLHRYSTVTKDLGCVPTFPITAVILKRNIKSVRKLLEQDVDLAIHGYIHIDYGQQPLEEQTKHYQRAVGIFNTYRVPYTGYRAPFLRTNSNTVDALNKSSFIYNSSQAFHRDVVNKADYPDTAWLEYQKLLDFYKSRLAQDYLVLPKLANGLVEIPVSIPDDEAMVERLGIIETKEMSNIWCSILEATYRNGELFTLQLHPERILECEKSLIDVIQQAQKLKPAVWIATLQEIAEWWRVKEQFSIQIDPKEEGRYMVRSKSTERATLLIKNCTTNVPTEEWHGGYQCVAADNFLLESSKCPAIGLSQNSSPAAISFLRNEGFLVETSDRPDDYGLYLNSLEQFSEAEEKALSREIEQSNAPLVRYWRWPDRARCALSITGDIDSITIFDFILRIVENSLQNSRIKSR